MYIYKFFFLQVYIYISCSRQPRKAHQIDKSARLSPTTGGFSPEKRVNIGCSKETPSIKIKTPKQIS